MSVTIVTVGPSLPSEHAQCRANADASSTTMYIFFLEENYNSQETARRRRTASRCGPALSPPSSPALPVVPSPPSERGSETQRRWNRRGAPPPPPPPAAAPASPRVRICLEPSRSASQGGSVAIPPPAASPAFGSAANFPSLGSAGWRARRRRNAGLSARAARARTLLPPRSGSRGRAGIPATSNCPVSVAAGGVVAGPPRGAGQAGAQLPQRLTGAAGRRALPARLRAPAPEAAGSGVCGAGIPRPRRRKRLCPEPARRALPLCLGAGARVAKSEPRARRRVASCRRGAPRGLGARPKPKGNKRGDGLFFCLCETDNFFFLSLHNTDFQVSHSFYYDYCHHLCVSLAFPFIFGSQST